MISIRQQMRTHRLRGSQPVDYPGVRVHHGYCGMHSLTNCPKSCRGRIAWRSLQVYLAPRAGCVAKQRPNSLLLPGLRIGRSRAQVPSQTSGHPRLPHHAACPPPSTAPIVDPMLERVPTRPYAENMVTAGSLLLTNCVQATARSEPPPQPLWMLV